MRTKLDRYVDCVFIGVGAVLINVALVYGLGVYFGWWGLLFYLGLGFILGVLISR